LFVHIPFSDVFDTVVHKRAESCGTHDFTGVHNSLPVEKHLETASFPHYIVVMINEKRKSRCFEISLRSYFDISKAQRTAQA
jgi:hypothetical protein